MKELFINGKLVELDGKTKINLQFVSFLFTSINSISTPRSWTVSLPKSASNIALVEGATSADSDSDFPYDKYTVDYYVNGIRIINTGEAVLLNITSRIDFVFTFGKAFEKIKLMSETNLRELTEASTDFLPWNRSISFNDLTKGFGWCNYYSFTNEDRSYTTNADVPFSVVHPSVKLTYVMNKIQSFFGITLVGLLSAASLSNCAFPLRELEGVSVNAINISGSQAIASNQLNQVGYVKFNAPTGTSIKYFTLTDYITFNNTNSKEVVVNISNYFSRHYGAYGGSIFLVIVDNNGVSRNVIAATKTLDGFYSNFEITDFTFTVNSNDVLFGFYKTESADLIEAYVQFTTNADSAFYEPSTTGGFFPIIPNLPDMTCAEFIFQCMQLTALYPSVSDATPNQIDFATSQALYNNIGNAVDWSEKLVKKTARMSEPSDMEFKFGNYSQKNILKYKDDETNTLDTSGSIVVENKNLDDKSNLVELKFAAGKRFSVSDDVIDYPLYDIKVESGVLIKNKKTQSNDVLAKIFSVGSVNTLSFNDTMLFDIIANTEYLFDQLLIRKPRIIKETFKLKEYDIYAFSDKIPIYLQQFGKYYAPMKLQYKEDDYSECELLEIKNLEILQS